MSDILIHTEAGVTTLTLNRVDKKNSITVAMYAAMADALEAAAEKYSDNGHFPDCAVNDWTTADCNCGLAELEALLPGGDHGVVERLG